MVTAGTSIRKHAENLPGRRYDHVFFSGMALLILLTVFCGFARTYYLAGIFRAPLPSFVVHLHGAAFSCWILLLVASLIAAGRVDIHSMSLIEGFAFRGKSLLASANPASCCASSAIQGPLSSRV
jgi:hypothetical protein